MARDRQALADSFAAAWNAGDVEATLAYLDPGIEVDWSESNAPYRGVYRGVNGYRRLFAELRQSFQATRTEVHDRVVSGPHLAVANTAHMQGREGIEVAARSTIVFTFGDDDRIVAIRLFQAHDDALRAIGAEGSIG